MTVEKVAINLAESRIPDNDGEQPFDTPLREDGDTAYFATLPVKAMVKRINASGIPALMSYTAGTYVCNSIMYNVLYLLDRRFPGVKGGFIHVPYATAQGVGKPSGTPTMEITTMAKAIEAAIEAAVSSMRMPPTSWAKPTNHAHPSKTTDISARRRARSWVRRHTADGPNHLSGSRPSGSHTIHSPLGSTTTVGEETPGRTGSHLLFRWVSLRDRCYFNVSLACPLTQTLGNQPGGSRAFCVKTVSPIVSSISRIPFR